MENFNQNNQSENKETGWENTVEDQRAVIEVQIQTLKGQRLELENRMREELQYMRAMLIEMKWIIRIFTNQ